MAEKMQDEISIANEHLNKKAEPGNLDFDLKKFQEVLKTVFLVFAIVLMLLCMAYLDKNEKVSKESEVMFKSLIENQKTSIETLKEIEKTIKEKTDEFKDNGLKSLGEQVMTLKEQMMKINHKLILLEKKTSEKTEN